MKTYLTLLIFSTFSTLTFGQKVYTANREAYKLNQLVYEFYINDDSTCFLKGHHLENENYFLFEGYLKKTNDTLYEFKFQPIVNFGCIKRLENADSINFSITQKDTFLSTMNYNVKTNNGLEMPVSLEVGWTLVLVKGASKEKFIVNTKFNDPITKEIIYLAVDTLSEPDLTYYGASTDFSTIQISIVRDKLTIYPDHKFIQDKDTFIRTQ